MWKIIAFLICSALPLRAEMPARVEILPGWRASETRHIAALRITLAPGWKTYWRSPGDAGLPPAFDWSASRNLAGMRLHWPSPRLLSASGAEVIGYEGELVLPMEFELASDGPARLTGQVDLGLCKDVCMPQSLRFDLPLPEGGAPHPAINAALADQPRRGRATLRCAAPDTGRISVELERALAPGMGLALEMPGALIGQPEASPSASGTRISARLYAPAAIARDAIRLTVIDPAGGAVEYLGCS